jgi:hypothetical protein
MLSVPLLHYEQYVARKSEFGEGKKHVYLEKTQPTLASNTVQMGVQNTRGSHQSTDIIGRTALFRLLRFFACEKVHLVIIIHAFHAPCFNKKMATSIYCRMLSCP